MIETTQRPARHLQLEGAYNVRDTGGYACTDGHMTRWRTLLRGDSLHRLTDAAQAELLAAGLRTVIDLRHDTERAESPSVFAASEAVRYLHVPLIENTASEAAADSTRGLAEIYAEIILASHARICELFAALAEPGAFPALVHCTAGKDRTGIAIALLLGTAGVPAATIAADYALSETFLLGEWLEERKRAMAAAGRDWSLVEPLMASPEELMLHTLAAIDARHGSVPDYLLSVGVPRAHLDAVRTALRVDQAANVDARVQVKAEPATFVHLTDLHILPTEESRFFGQIDTMATLREALDLLRERGVTPGATFVISGDLTNNGERESYVRLRAIVDELRQQKNTVHLALGNHDDRANFLDVMQDEATSDPAQKYRYAVMLGEVRLVVLDTNQVGTHDGLVGPAQIAWLQDVLTTPAPGGTVIVVHHPPSAAPMPALANHMLEDADALREAIAGTDVIGILSGHTHVVTVELVGAAPCVTAPGTAFMLDITAKAGMRFFDGGGINLITVKDGVMTAKPLSLPRSQRELWQPASCHDSSDTSQTSVETTTTAR